MTEQAPYVVDLAYIADRLGMSIATIRQYHKRACRNRREGRIITTDMPAPDYPLRGRPLWLPETADNYIALRLATKRGKNVDTEPRPRDGHGRYTSGGVEITDELVQQLADEAEAGYDPDKLVPRPVAQRGPSGGRVMVRLSKAEQERVTAALHAVDPEKALTVQQFVDDGPRGWSDAMWPVHANLIAAMLTEAWSKGHKTYELATRFAEEREPARRTKRGGWAAGVQPGDRTE